MYIFAVGGREGMGKEDWAWVTTIVGLTQYINIYQPHKKIKKKIIIFKSTNFITMYTVV